MAYEILTRALRKVGTIKNLSTKIHSNLQLTCCNISTLVYFLTNEISCIKDKEIFYLICSIHL